MSEVKHFDHHLIQGYLDNVGSAVVEKMLSLYMQQSAIYMDEISLAVEQQSQEMWHERCHKMKGAAGSVGLSSVHAYLASVEKSDENWQIKAGYLKEIASKNSEAIECFKAWLATQG